MKEPDGDGCVGQVAGSNHAAGAPEEVDPSWLSPVEQHNRFMAILKTFPEDEPVPLQPFLQFRKLRRILGFEWEGSPAEWISPTTAARISIRDLHWAWGLSTSYRGQVGAAALGVQLLDAEPAGSIDTTEPEPAKPRQCKRCGWLLGQPFPGPPPALNSLPSAMPHSGGVDGRVAWDEKGTSGYIDLLEESTP